MQRLSLVDVVEEAGYPGAGAADADQALAILERRPDIGINLVNIDMPGSVYGLRLSAMKLGMKP